MFMRSKDRSCTEVTDRVKGVGALCFLCPAPVLNVGLNPNRNSRWQKPPPGVIKMN